MWDGLPTLRRQQLLFGALVISLLIVTVYSALAHLQVTRERIRLLHVLATCHNPYTIWMHLGSIYVDAGEYNMAMKCYKNAEPYEFKSLRFGSPSLGVE